MRASALRRLKTVFASAIVALTLLVFGAAPALAFDRQASERAMLRLVNQARTSRGLCAVRSFDALRKAARAHSTDMLRREYFAHSSLSGLTAGARARRAGYGVSGWSQWSVGEVIAWGAGSVGAPQVVFKAWMKSKSHRAIILGRRWRDVGVGCSRGTFRGMGGVSMWTVDFGRRVQ